MKCVIFLAFLAVASAVPPPEVLSRLFKQEGKCPNIPFVKDFTPEKLVGKWFSIKQFGPAEQSCIHYEVSQLSPTRFKSVMKPSDRFLELEQVKADDVSQGYTILSKENPVLFEANFRIYATDYDNYATSVICKEKDDKHQTFVYLWSRTPKISEKALEIYKELVEKYSLDTSITNDVNQADCDVAAEIPASV